MFQQKVDEAHPPAASSSAERSLRLLAKLADEGRALSLADLATYLALPKATAHRLCSQLLETGFIARGVNEREFVVGPALRRLAFDTLNHGTVSGLRHQVLAGLVDQVGETCNFTTLDGAQVLYLDRVEAPRPWRLTLDAGVHVPLHCTASGKLFLALMPHARREQLLGKLVLAALTSHSITNADSLRAECEKIAQAGYAIDHEEFIDGLTAIAVPVYDSTGQQRAALATHASRARLSFEKMKTHLPALRSAAERMGRLL